LGYRAVYNAMIVCSSLLSRLCNDRMQMMWTRSA